MVSMSGPRLELRIAARVEGRGPGREKNDHATAAGPASWAMACSSELMLTGFTR